MKSKYILILFAAFAFFYVSCEKNDINVDTTDQQVKVGALCSSVTIDTNGTSTVLPITVTPEEKDWSATSSDDWCKVSKTTTTEYGKEEQAIEISTDKNTGYGRSSIITITAGSGSDTDTTTVKVDQESALEEPAISADPESVDLIAKETSDTISVITNQDSWNAVSSEEWCTLEQDGSALIIQATGNQGDSARVTTITLTAGPEGHIATSEIIVIQAKPDNEYNITVNGIEFVLVEAGTFNMGAQSTDPNASNYYANAADNQSPVHSVTISKDFYIGKYELTQAQYEKIMDKNPSSFVNPNKPVEMVNYDDAQNFINALNIATGKTFRLPTEAEWEYAAREGSKSNGYIYSGSNNLDDVVVYGQGKTYETSVVGSKNANELGIYDMSGNIYEWCSDLFGDYTSSSVTDPTGATDGTKRVLRGGSAYHSEKSEAVSYRGSNTDDFFILFF